MVIEAYKDSKRIRLGDEFIDTSTDKHWYVCDIETFSDGKLAGIYIINEDVTHIVHLDNDEHFFRFFEDNELKATGNNNKDIYNFKKKLLER